MWLILLNLKHEVEQAVSLTWQQRRKISQWFNINNCKNIKNVVSSASEVEIAALFINARASLPLRVALEEMGHKQPATKPITDNSTAYGILNGTIKQN
jgi:hypothetical protein